jgi:hypothetical protein
VDALHSGHDPNRHQSRDLATATHEDIAAIVADLRKCAKLKRPEIRTKLLLRFRGAQDLSLNRAIDVAIRWWLMISVREERFEDLYAKRPFQEWNDNESLEDFIEDRFPHAKSSLSARESRLNPFFTVTDMVKICGLENKMDSVSGRPPVP